MVAQWPPRSPHEALLSTPGGREKLRRLAERTSPSPSPSRLRTSRSISALASRPGTGEDGLFEGGDMDEDEDEETLQLKLQAIQARLRLKKLQAAKAQKKSTAPPAPGPGDGGGMREVPIQSKLAAARDRLDRQAAGDVVQVPASPVRKAQPTSDVQTSPQRVLMGIDKGLRGADVSLKRAPSQKALNDTRQVQQGGWLRRTESRLSDQAQSAPSRPLSFNERLASARTEEVARQEKRERAQKQRSTAFSVGREEMEGYKTKAQELPELPSKPQEFSREQILSSLGRPSGGQLQRSNTAPSMRSGEQVGDTSDPFSSSTTGTPGSEGAFEPYSGLHLSKRILPHNVLARAVSGKKSYLLKDLLRQVKAPEWSLPDDEPDVVIFAIVASKSDPRSHRPGPGGDGKAQQDRGKYMVLTLVDLTFEVELFLFNSGFDRFWKLTPGTVLAILNPGILPPPPGREATNRFGLVINSDEDTILEIGNARDIGYCKSIKKDGSYCKSWVNARRTEYCEFHTNEAVRKARTARIEMSSTAGFGGDGPRGRTNSRRLHGKPEDEQLKRGGYDRSTQSQYFISTAHRATDPDDERITGIADRKEREEGLKRRLAQKEKERDIARRLGEFGAGAGKDYMTRAASRPSTTTASSSFTSSSSFTTRPRPPHASSSFSSATSSFSSSAAPTSATTSASSLGTAAAAATADDQRQQLDARALGLVGRRGADQPKIHLGPAPTFKRKRRVLGVVLHPTNNAGNKAPLGWGTSLKDKLGRMKEGERLDGRTMDPPLLLSATCHFSYDIGASTGFERWGSLGEPLSAALKTRRQVVLLDDDGDDELIIVQVHESPSLTQPPGSHHGGNRTKISDISINIGISFISAHYPDFGRVDTR
ncbi:hypothetical protein NEMBOFW57_008929 [Staphylotrichum longicolle]|uniref:Zinc finger Mcm10/DnaG-type domain-containing protein n=1 Tax=Staphylotrichum longicolle TaxID=669026 RepID=A0AAD4ES76_9PEZI|nr:hypothetical protein NEMBOFW57_008929 [Staphylotrichum longicolle]